MATVGAAGIAYAFVYKEDITETTGLTDTSEKITSSSHGFSHYITSLVKEDDSEVLTDLPVDFAGTGGAINDNAYACRLTIEKDVINSEGVSEKQPHFIYDYTCSLFKLDNFQNGGSKTLNLPLNTDSSMLVREKSQIAETDQQLLRLNKKFLNMFPKGTSKVSIVDKETTTKTYMELKLDFAFSLSDARAIPSNLFSAWVQEKNNRPTSLASLSAETKFYCQLGTEDTRRPCKIYKYSDHKKTNKFTSEDLKTLSPITDFDNDVKAEEYYVVDFLRYKKTFPQISNLEINVYDKNTTTNTSYLIMTLNYDKHLFGKYTKQNEHKLYFQTPEKRVYLAQKTKDSEAGKLTSPSFTGNETNRNYKCRLMGNGNETPTIIDNLDGTCKLIDLPSINGNQKSVDLTPDVFKELKNAPTTLDNKELFKLEVDSTALFNLHTDITAHKNQKVKIMAEEQQTNDNRKKHFIELELIQEFTGVPEKLVGRVQYLLVQVRNSASKFEKTSNKALQCKFYEPETGFSCNLYAPKAQKSELLKVGATEGLEEVDLMPGVKENFDKAKLFAQKQHFIVDLIQPVPIAEVLNRRKLFYIYQSPVDGGKQLPGLQSEQTTQGTTNTSSTSVTKTPATQINFSIIKLLNGNPSTDKPMYFISQ